MKYLPLIYAGLLRRKVRAVFTALTIVAAFALFGLLQGLNYGMSAANANLNANRLYTLNKFNQAQGMPVAYTNRIAALPNVRHVAHLTVFGGYYQDKRNPVTVFATNMEENFRAYPELEISKASVAEAQRVRTAAVISKVLAKRYGWKVGDVVPLASSIWIKENGQSDFQFEIKGVFDPGDFPGGAKDAVYINYDYLDKARRSRKGRVHQFVVYVSDPSSADGVSRAIDAMFANSSDQTKTQNEKIAAQSQMKQLADIGLIANSIVGAVLFTLLFLIANTMSESIRERLPEIAVLKTLGFKDGSVAGFVIIEALTLCLGSALVGVLVARAVLPMFKEQLGPAAIPPLLYAGALALAAVLALVSALAPCWRSYRLNIVDALTE
jgi:putative ABC transport system permease protein